MQCTQYLKYYVQLSFSLLLSPESVLGVFEAMDFSSVPVAGIVPFRCLTIVIIVVVFITPKSNTIGIPGTCKQKQQLSLYHSK